MKLAVLLCDTPPDSIKQVFGDYSVLFSKLLANNKLDVSFYDAVNKKLPLINNYDAFLLTGSKYSANDSHDWISCLIDFLIKVKDTKAKKVVGICFGHQLIARAFGGKVVKNPLGWEIGLKKVILTATGEEFYKSSDTTDSTTKTLMIQEMHQDHVVNPPEFMKVIGGNEISPNQIMISDYFYSLQGHPEYSREFVDALIKMRLSSGVFTPEMVSSASGSGLEASTELLRNSIWKFLGI